MDPLEFCRQIMGEYEEQWTEAHGHQERHPLRVKMDLLEGLMDRLHAGEDFQLVLLEGCRGDDPLLFLLCEELRPRWETQRVR